MNLAGRLNKRIIICRKNNGINEDTGRDEGLSYLNLKEIWAGIEHISLDDEKLVADSVTPIDTLKITIRYQRTLDITNEFSVLYNEKYYDVLAVNNVNEKNEKMILTCRLAV